MLRFVTKFEPLVDKPLDNQMVREMLQNKPVSQNITWF